MAATHSRSRRQRSMRSQWLAKRSPRLTGSDGDADLADRAEALIRSTAHWAFDHERELRAVLAISLTDNAAERGLTRRGRMQRDRWIDELLSGLPVEVPPAARSRLRAALTPLFGADAVVWPRDVADLSVSDAVDGLAWMARTMVTAVLAETQAPGGPDKLS